MDIISDWIKRALSDGQMVLLFVVVSLCAIGIVLFADMLAPVIAAIVIAFLLDGTVTWLKKRGVSHFFASIVVFIAFSLTGLIVIITILPLLFEQIAQFINTTPAMMTSLQSLLLSLQKEFPDILSATQVHVWFVRLGEEVANMGPKLLQYSLTGVAGALTIAVYMILVPVMVFFFLKDKEQIISWLSGFFPNERGLVTEVWKESVERAGDYARGKLYEIIIVGIASFAVYQFLGLKFATLLAVVTGFSVLVPYIGAAIVTLPVALVAYAQWGFGADLAWTVIAYLILQALDGNVLVPFMFSEVVNLHPNAIIVAILIFGGIWGLWGVFFAIPLATMANAVIRVWKNRSNELSGLKELS
jgi:putative permease